MLSGVGLGTHQVRELSLFLKPGYGMEGAEQ